MAKPRSPHHGDADADGPSRGRPVRGAAPESVVGAEETIAQAVRTGRTRDVPVRRVGDGPPADLVTQASGTPGGRPAGRPAVIDPEQDDGVRRSLELENSAAVVMAGQGFQIKQNPTAEEVARAREGTGDTGNPRKRPDYLIEGRVFDGYSPTNPAKSPRGIWTAVEEKVVEGASEAWRLSIG
jgi:hypothetical protein